MPYPNLPANGTPVALLQRDYSDGNGPGGAQTVEVGGLDASNAGAPTRVATIGSALQVAALLPVGGALVDLAVTAGAKTAGTVLGDTYELPGSFGQITPGLSVFDLLSVQAIDYSAVIDGGELELWFFQSDPGFTDGSTFDLTHASLFTTLLSGAPVLLDTRSDTASSRVLTPSTSQRRPLAFPAGHAWMVVVVRGAGFTLPVSPNLAFGLLLAGLG